MVIINFKGFYLLLCFGFCVQNIKVCTTAQLCSPLATGTSQRRSRRSRCYSRSSERELLCRTARGEEWPFCGGKHNPWSVNGKFWGRDGIILLAVFAYWHDRLDLTWCWGSHLSSQFKRNLPDGAERRIESSLGEILVSHLVSKRLQQTAYVSVKKLIQLLGGIAFFLRWSRTYINIYGGKKNRHLIS